MKQVPIGVIAALAGCVLAGTAQAQDAGVKQAWRDITTKPKEPKGPIDLNPRPSKPPKDSVTPPPVVTPRPSGCSGPACPGGIPFHGSNSLNRRSKLSGGTVEFPIPGTGTRGGLTLKSPSLGRGPLINPIRDPSR